MGTKNKLGRECLRGYQGETKNIFGGRTSGGYEKETKNKFVYGTSLFRGECLGGIKGGTKNKFGRWNKPISKGKKFIWGWIKPIL